MSILHLCNTFFEQELSGQIPDSIEKAFAQNSILMQLQFLPLLYANTSDGLLVTERPEKELNLELYLLGDTPPFSQLETWGYSNLAKQWADSLGILYEMPPWDVVKMVNSKAYSFAQSPLPGAKLLYEGDPIPANVVLKSCFGAAGRGLIFSDTPKAQKFCKTQWEMGLPVIAEPWVKRIVDFSTQWKISPEKEISFIGTTFCKTTPSGIHHSNTVGDWEKELDFSSFIDKQKTAARPVLKEMAEMGYFGEVGFDAMIYNEHLLQPIVEINARKTMGLVTLMLQQRDYPDQKITLTYAPTKNPGPLPQTLGRLKFSRQLVISIH